MPSKTLSQLTGKTYMSEAGGHGLVLFGHVLPTVVKSVSVLHVSSSKNSIRVQSAIVLHGE